MHYFGVHIKLEVSKHENVKQTISDLKNNVIIFEINVSYLLRALTIELNSILMPF